MKRKERLKLNFIPLFLAIATLFAIPRTANNAQYLSTRSFDVNEIGSLSFEEEAHKILNAFDDYSLHENENAIKFEATKDISDFDLSLINFLSTNAQETIKKYKTNLDIDNDKFEVITEYIQDDKVIFSEKIETTPYYDEFDNNYYVLMPDGTNVSVAETLLYDSFNECSITLGTIGVGLSAAFVAVMLAAVVIVAAPMIVEVIEIIITTVVTWIRNFWNWLTSLWSPKTTTVETAVVTTELSYTITLSGIKVDTAPFDKTKTFETNEYYIAIADTDDGLLYVSHNPITVVQALAILTTSTYVNSAHKGSNKQFVVSLYTVTDERACLIAGDAGTILKNPGYTLHLATKAGFFNHYHPGTVDKNNNKDILPPHVFFGMPRI